MLRLPYITKRLCHHHSRSIVPITPVFSNPLVECEGKIKKQNIKETNIFIDNNYKLVHSEEKLLPIQIHYYNNNKLCKITIHLS